MNSSAAQGFVAMDKPFTAIVEAAPSPCYTLKQLLVNGTPVESSRLELRVAGNTTVSAVFERSKVRVRLESNVDGAALLLGGSVVALPASVEVLCGSTVQLSASAGRG